MSSVAALRQLLDQRFPDAAPVTYGTTGVVATGVSALDDALPAGGLPRGKVTAWRPGGGATAVLRSACGSAVGRGERAAWVDGSGSVVGAYWRSGPVLLRPESRVESLECAEELLKSGGFAVVVLTLEGEGEARDASLAESEAVRLARAAREGGVAFVVLSSPVSAAQLRARSRIVPGGHVWRYGPFGEPVSVRAVTVEARLEVMGRPRRARFTLPVRGHELRLCQDPELVDRRGVRR